MLEDDSRWWCTVLTAAQFRDMHRLEGLHSRAYLAIPALLVENKAEPVRSVSVFLRQYERVERRFHRVFLCSESQAARQAELQKIEYLMNTGCSYFFFLSFSFVTGTTCTPLIANSIYRQQSAVHPFFRASQFSPSTDSVKSFIRSAFELGARISRRNDVFTQRTSAN